MSSSLYQTEEQVMFFDTDIGGVVHNLAYLRMIETCRTKFAETVGFELKAMAKDQVFPVIVRTEIDYRRSATLGDYLVISGKLHSYSRSSFWCEFEVRNKEENSNLLYVTCKQKLAVVQMPSGRPKRIPANVIEYFKRSLETF